ncbi:hypothetical protein HGRIS_013627 [Hohenbuehelia grisea]|uniref:RING-type domain-containing protein n=1 Tax=Hohenbuehelia grisea TaxID=104357 RepID=A0ABR3IW50_9AGAR
MSNTRVQLTHPLPAPVVHAGFSIPQSKSHVLAGVQDAYWSDDEAESAECPLCMEEMDLDDLNFKPCICGYQICRFCWHHIKENLNKLCPACRREYSNDPIEFKTIAKEDHKRLMQQKKQRERERKDLDALGRRHLANVRVVQRNVVYVVGIGPKYAKEELISTLRSHEFFGQYGKISKIVIVKRNPPGGGSPVVGLYITYHRREDAARCIAAVDGTASYGGGSRDVMRASYGTTKYCMAFLRGASCNDHSCMNLHEWGEEKDCFTKEDLTTLKHTMKASESRTRTIASRKGDEAEGLPKAASWGHKAAISAAHPATTPTAPSPTPARATRRVAGVRQGRTTTASGSQTSNANESRFNTNNQEKKRASSTKPASQSSSSPPETPAPPGLPPRPATPPEVKVLRQSESSAPQPSSSPAPSTVAESDVASSIQDLPVSPIVHHAANAAPSTPFSPPGLPSVPPGLAAPPGIPSPSRPPRSDSAQGPPPASQSSYQMSTAAQALLADLQARRDAAPSNNLFSPFPDFDRTIENLSGGDQAGFSFNLDPSIAVEPSEEPLPDLEAEANIPFHGTYMDAFPALRNNQPSQPPGLSGQTSYTPPPGLAYPHNPSRSIYDPLAVRASPIAQIERQSTGDSYTGSFNPFADANDDAPTTSFASPARHQLSPLDDEGRKVSRFGFARGRQGSTAASSPLHASSPLSAIDGHSQAFYNSVDYGHSSAWPVQNINHGRGSAAPSPLIMHSQPAMPPNRYQSFEAGVSEAQLRELIQTSRDRERALMNSNSVLGVDMNQSNQHVFQDPAIMSARLASDNRYMPSMSDDALPPHLAYGPPPGLSLVPNMLPNNGLGNVMENTVPLHALSTSPILSSSDFPALSATSPVEPPPVPEAPSAPTPDAASEATPAKTQAEEKAAKKAAKKAEKAAERQRIAQERATAKAAEKARQTAEKAAEKEKAAALKAQQEKEAKEKAEKERQRVAKLEEERQQKAEKEREKLLAEKERLTALLAAQRDEKAILTAKVKAFEADKKSAKKAAASSKQAETPKSIPRAASSSTTASQPASKPPPQTPSSPSIQVPLLSKKPKKNKPLPKPAVKVTKEEEPVSKDPVKSVSTPVSEANYVPLSKGNALDTGSVNSRAQSVDRKPNQRTALAALMDELNVLNPNMDLETHPFFDTAKINPAAKMPLEYGPLVHALSALSVGGGSFANNMPSRSIDNAVSSFQQLLETLTQTISDLLRLLPRTTWDDSSSFDGVLRDMLKGDDFFDGGEEQPAKEDEVAALTLALERRARWMEVQLSKLEELHRDINNAAVRAVLTFNDSGWDRHGSLPRAGNTLRRFNNIGMIDEGGSLRAMTTEELEKKLIVAKEAAIFAETEFREAMDKMQVIRPEEPDY